MRSRGDYGSRKVIALGTPKELIATVGGEDIVEFAVDHRPERQAVPSEMTSR